jgi:quercetin dioxygenase-like cupin family protein
MYCRKVFRPAGTVIVGKIHKKPHFFLCAKGEIIAWTELGMRTLRAGDIVESKPGTKRVTYAIKDSIGITFHKTDNTDLNKIEAELIEPDNTALFDSSNNIKQFVIEAQRALKGE